MKIQLSVIIIAASFQVVADESREVKGLLSWNDNYFAEVTECGTGTRHTFGVMASAPYFKLTKTSDRLAKKGAIIVTAKGIIDNQNTIISPVVLSINNGDCKL